MQSMTGALGRGLPERLGRISGAALTPHLLLLLAVIFWGANSVSVKDAVSVHGIDPVGFGAVRFLIAGVVLAVAARAMGHRLLAYWDTRNVLFAAAIGVVANQLMYTFALKLTTAIDVNIVLGLNPLASAGLAAIYFRRPIERVALVSLLLGFAGLVLVVVASGAGLGGNLLGDLVAVGVPISWAVYTVHMRTVRSNAPPVVQLAWTMLVSALILSVMALSLPGRKPPASVYIAAAPSFLYSALIASAFCYAAYFWALNRLGVTAAVMYMYLQPVFGTAAAVVLLGERLRSAQLLGAVVVVIACYVGSIGPAARYLWRRLLRRRAL